MTEKSSCKILIVDDEGDICYLLSNLMKQRDLQYEHANTLAQADIIIKEDTPDIIFLDNHLPDGLGINYIENIKENYPNIKIAVITAHDTLSDKKKALKKGADIFITKPFTTEQINACVNELMDPNFTERHT